jgi:hypothetical protein
MTTRSMIRERTGGPSPLDEPRPVEGERPGRFQRVRPQFLAGMTVTGVLAPVLTGGVQDLWSRSHGVHGVDALLIPLLLAVAVTALALCTYLFMVWALSSLVLLLGGTGPGARTALRALGVVAPRAARRLTVTLAVSGAGTVLVLAPAQASVLPVDPLPDPVPVTQGLSVVPTEDLPTEEVRSAPVLRPLGGAGNDPADEGSDLPSLGFSPTPESPDSSAQGVRTVTVRAGDCLWTITDDLLGPNADPDADIASAWPRLSERNRDVIGSDPDLLEPGQVLEVPEDLAPASTRGEDGGQP